MGARVVTGAGRGDHDDRRHDGDEWAQRHLGSAQVLFRPRPTTFVMARSMFRGTTRPPVVSALYCRPGTMTTLPLATSAMHSRTTSSTSSQRNEGVLAMSMPARA